MLDLQTQFKALEWRNIGPHRGGRVVAVAGDPADPMTFYFGACAGGVWKTTDGGTYWENVSDGFFNTAAVGALAVADSDPNVIYAGMGECCIRGDVSHGDGVYRSTDKGRTWRHRGLAETRHIARIRVHPRDPETVFVAALGPIYGPHARRGVFRSRDGGASWDHVLYRDANSGAIDLSLDPHNPRVLYAATWDVRRTPWELRSGGPGSALYKSADGGDSWTDIFAHPGLPTGIKGRIGVAVSPADSNRVFALVEAPDPDSGLYRSDDAGATWERISDHREIQGRRWYYMHIFADPQDADTVYALAGNAFKSSDGGATWTQFTTPHADNHDLWIDPRNPKRMIEGNDGGACVSFNGARTWSSIYNQPTAQFYHVATDTRFPYRLYGTQQDNTAISVPSRSNKGAIPFSECEVTGHSESGHIQVRPDDANIVYSGAVGSSPGGGGALLRYDHRTGQSKIITTWPEFYGGHAPKDLKYRFQWTYPILLSPHDSNTLYVCGNVVFRSRDEGMSWDVISPDLTRNDPAKLAASGGPITLDTTGAEHYCTIYAFAESPHERGVLWAGSDDGLVHLSRDGGVTWNDVTPPQLPEWATISTIEVSPHDPATAYLAAHRYRLDDNRPLLHRTSDYGTTWTTITDGIPATDFTRVIRADPERRGLLFAGTETSLYLSLDDGALWQPFRLNLPAVPVYDLQIKDGDLLAATHGRSFWIMDDLTPLRALRDAVLEADGTLFPVRSTVRFRGGLPPRGNLIGVSYAGGTGGIAYYDRKQADGESERVLLDAGRNPPEGVSVSYFLRESPRGPLTLEFLDAQGAVIRTFTSKLEPPDTSKPQAPDTGNAEAPANPSPALSAAPAPVAPSTAAPLEEAEDEDPTTTVPTEDRRVPKQPGLNRFTWNLRYPDAHKVPGDIPTERSLAGPLAPPGAYQVRLTVNGASQTERFAILKDPRAPTTQEDLDAQFELALQLRDTLSATHDAINRLRSLLRQLEDWEQRAPASRDPRRVRESAARLKTQLAAIEDALIQTRARGESDRLNYPGRLNVKLVHLSAVVASADAAPTQQSYAVFQHLSAQIDAQLAALKHLEQTELRAFADLVREVNTPLLGP